MIPFIPIAITLGTLGTLYGTRGPVDRVVSGHRYLVGAPRNLFFMGLTDAQIRATFASRPVTDTLRDAKLRKITSTHVWFTAIWNGETTDTNFEGNEETQGFYGPYALAFGSY